MKKAMDYMATNWGLECPETRDGFQMIQDGVSETCIWAYIQLIEKLST